MIMQRVTDDPVKPSLTTIDLLEEGGRPKMLLSQDKGTRNMVTFRGYVNLSKFSHTRFKDDIRLFDIDPIDFPGRKPYLHFMAVNPAGLNGGDIRWIMRMKYDVVFENRKEVAVSI